MDRRTLIGVTGLAAAGALASAGTKALVPQPAEFVPLWPGTPPGGGHVQLVPQEANWSRRTDFTSASLPGFRHRAFSSSARHGPMVLAC